MPFVFFNNTIIVQVRYIIIETKEVARVNLKKMSSILYHYVPIYLIYFVNCYSKI
jgi:hypothetical protein